MGAWRTAGSQVLHAHLAAADSGQLLAGFECLGGWLALEGTLDGGEPEAVLVGEVVAGPLGPVALDEGRGAEVLQAGAG